MRVFNINKAIGLASSGVEYAQKYRRELFADIAWVEDFYVFTDYISPNINVFSDRLGFAREQVLWIYNLVTGRGTAASTLSVEDFIATLSGPHSAAQNHADYIEVALGDSTVRYRIRTTPSQTVDRVETWVGDQVLRVAHYDQSLNNVEHFHHNHLQRRVFFTQDGEVGAEQFYQDQAITRT
ncbi:MAG: hypothetical protein FWG16_00805, partial [Micrococcales bacterium]|nr:hypothetical protein [Micrococcales bacterium]